MSVGGRKTILSLGLVAACIGSESAFARKTNQPVYEDPFDLGAGGASLTRASKEGRVFANPALLSQGGGFHRWMGTTVSLLANKESVQNAKILLQRAQKSQSGETPADEEAQAAEDDQTDQIIEAATSAPIRAGWGAALSWITRFFGLSVISRFEPDIRVREIGATGLPEVHFQAESYHGAGLGMTIPTGFRWLSLGVTGKYLYAAEPDIKVELANADAVAELTNPELIQDLTAHNSGIGFDAGALVFIQGQTLDLSIAAKVDDFGNTKLSGANPSPTEFKQVVSGGLGVALHTGADAIHLALDYRDILNVYGEEMFKKVYAGTKILLRTYLGISAGYYNGYPSLGAEVDLIFLRLAATSYTREFGEHPGADPRRIYLGSLSLGF